MVLMVMRVMLVVMRSLKRRMRMSECLVMAGGFVVSSAIVLALMDTVGGA